MRVAAFLIASCLWPVAAWAAPLGEEPIASPSVSGSTTWVSRQGSIMVLDLGDNGRLEGYFVNNAPGKGCRGIPYDLKGQILGEAIIFRVSWRNGVADCMMGTEWHGRVQRSPSGGMEIVSEWQNTPATTVIDLSDTVPANGEDLFVQQVTPGLQPQAGL